MKGFSKLLQALTLLPFITKAAAAERAVFAHFMVSQGNLLFPPQSASKLTLWLLAWPHLRLQS